MKKKKRRVNEVRTKSLKTVIGIFSMMIALLILCIFDISRLVEFKNMVLGVTIHLILFIGITQIFYLGGISIATILTKYHLWKEAKEVAKITAKGKQARVRLAKIENLKSKEVQNEN